MKKAIIAGGIFAVIVIGALAVAAAGAQTNTPAATLAPSSTTSPGTGNDTLRQQFLQDLASRLGVSVDTLQGDIKDTEKALIDKAVTDGKLTQNQANDLKTRIDNGENVQLGQILGNHRKGIRGVVNDIIGEAATVLGLQKSDVTDGLKAGTSLNDIANAHGASTAGFHAKLLAQVKTDLDAQVASGDITQAQADQAYQMFSDNIDKITNGTRGDFGPGFRHGPGHGGHGFGGPGFGGPNDNGSVPGAPSAPAPSGGPTTIF
jgi:polyhydroxyalkanoate synthesis regulator phasin